MLGKLVEKEVALLGCGSAPSLSNEVVPNQEEEEDPLSKAPWMQELEARILGRLCM